MSQTIGKMKSPIKAQGDKWNLKEFILTNFPENYESMVYVEPFCAGATIFLNKNSSKEELINDIDDEIVSIFRAIRDEPKEFISRVTKITHSERVFNTLSKNAEQGFDDYFEKGVNQFLLRKMSRGESKKIFAGSEKVNEEGLWDSIAEKIHLIAERLKDTTIICSDFIEIVKFWDEEDTLFYIDPPELQSNEEEKNCKSNFSLEDHMNLIHLIKNAKAKVIISGRSCQLYNRSFKHWKKKINQGKTKSDCIWFNY